ncbi:MAG: hypothetical protein PWQ89_1563, partial [Verrucomicrobiota bacterium]|nr:hypothetical protein [Verrucomicrobiota bacterium]
IDASQKEGDGERCELKAAQKMIGRQEDLTNTVITADALNAQKDTARAIAGINRLQNDRERGLPRSLLRTSRPAHP